MTEKKDDEKEKVAQELDRALSKALLFGVIGQKNLKKEAEFLYPVIQRFSLHPVKTMAEIARGSYTRDRRVEHAWTGSTKALQSFFDLVNAVTTSPKDCFKCKHLSCNETTEWCGHTPTGKFDNAKDCEHFIYIDWYLRFIMEPGYLAEGD